MFKSNIKQYKSNIRMQDLHIWIKGEIPHIPIVLIYWLLTLMFPTGFLSARLSTGLTKSTKSENPDWVVTLIVWSTNATGSNYLKQVIIWINAFHLIVLIKTNTFLIDWGELDIYCHIACNQNHVDYLRIPSLMNHKKGLWLTIKKLSKKLVPLRKLIPLQRAILD